MWDGMLSRLAAASLAVGIGGCGATFDVDQASPVRTHADSWSVVQRQMARPNVFRAKLDAARGVVWTLHVDGVEIHDATSAEEVRSIRLPGWTWASEQYACLPDFTVGPGGDVLVTSNVMPVIWRIDSASFEVTRHDLAVDEHGGKDIGFSALTYSTSQDAFFAVNALDGSLWRIDPRLVRAQVVELRRGDALSC